jgi:hypothetical protein
MNLNHRRGCISTLRNTPAYCLLGLKRHDRARADGPMDVETPSEGQGPDPHVVWRALRDTHPKSRIAAREAPMSEVNSFDRAFLTAKCDYSAGAICQ